MSLVRKNSSTDGVPLRDASRSAERDLAEEMALVVRSALEALVARQRPDHPFIDMKFDPVTGEDFDTEDALRGRGVVYAWIQGRGLEALAGHERWLGETPGDEALRAEICNILERVSDRMEALRRGSHLPFFLTSDGTPLKLDKTGVPVQSEAPQEANLADLFYAKGLAASAACLGDRQKLTAAEGLFEEVIASLRNGTFRSGQVAFDVRNPVAEVPGRFSQGPWMIALGGATTFLRHTGKKRHAELGRELITHVLSRHVQTEEGRFRPGDFWEFVDANGRPWVNDGRLWSDPGHATEFAGLALAHLAADPRNGDAHLREVLRRVLVANFRNGFTGRGLVKAFDLVRREAINTDQPWWSLPETMRAAALSLEYAPREQRRELKDILTQCWRAFREYYVRPACGHHAVQCLDGQGKVSTAIPAVPDLDPCYHTGLSLIDVLQACVRTENRRIS